MYLNIRGFQGLCPGFLRVISGVVEGSFLHGFTNVFVYAVKSVKSANCNYGIYIYIYIYMCVYIYICTMFIK